MFIWHWFVNWYYRIVAGPLWWHHLSTTTELVLAKKDIKDLKVGIAARDDTIALLSKTAGPETALAANLDQVRHFAARRTIESLRAENARLKERLKNA